ncbi:MAG: hypothetical protein ACRDRI_03170 [Pseudonocardiaceae bacterium]
MRPEDEPLVLGLNTEAASAADLAKCLSDIGELAQAINLGAAVLRDYGPWRVRARCFVQADLTGTHLVGRDFEQAAALG